MGKIKIKKLNNQGSTFVLSLLVITLLTTLALALANASLGNMMMKSVDRNSKNTFYTSETLLDEIRASVGHSSLRNLATAYEDVLTSIVDTKTGFQEVVNNTDANNQLKAKYVENVLKEITNGAVVFSGEEKKAFSTDLVNASDVHKNIASYINNTYIEGYDAGMASVKTIGSVEAYKDFAEDCKWKVIVKDVVINYKEKKVGETYFSNITVDLEIEYPNMMVDFTNTNRLTDFINYSLIANGSVKIPSQKVNVNASVYAGNTIDIMSNSDYKGAEVVFAPKAGSVMNIDVICGSNSGQGAIRVGGNGSVSSKVQFNSTNIWCTNIATMKKFEEGSTQDATAGAEIFIDTYSNSYVRDDLSVDAQKSDVRVFGTYYGYKYDGIDSAVGHLASSAIIVNGRNSKLTLGPSYIFLGGRAYIDISSGAYKTGESLSLRASQEVYLVPSEFLGVNFGTTLTNPMSKDVWDVDLGDKIGQPNDVTGEIIKECEIPDDYFAKEYLADPPYTIRRHNDMVYVYFNFKHDGTGRDYEKEYIKAVVSGANDDMYDKLERYNKNLFGGEGSVIKVEPGISIDATGILMETESGNPGFTDTNMGMVIPVINQTSTDLDNRYNIYTHLLATIPWDDGTSRYYVYGSNNNNAMREALAKLRGYVVTDDELNSILSQNNIMNNIINMNLLKEQGNEYNPAGEAIDYGPPTKKYVKIATNADVSIDDSNEIDGGIIITTGNVTVARNFEGLIIAGGDIKFDNDATISTNINMIEEFIIGKEKFRNVSIDEEDCPFKDYFLAYKSSAVDTDSSEAVKIENVDYKDLVYFNNWRKYED